MGATSNCKAAKKGGNKVRVVARIRPLSARETSDGSAENLRKLEGKSGDTALVQVDGCNGTSVEKKKWYELDAVLDGSASQSDVYAQSGARKAIQEDLFAGWNASILAYGQTGAG